MTSRSDVEVQFKKKLLAGAVFTFCTAIALTSFTSRALAEPIRLGVFRGPPSALVYIADSQGFFKKRSVDVVMKEYEAGVTAVHDLIAGTVDIAVATGFVVVMQSFTQPGLRIAASICVATDQELVVRKDRGINVPTDLKGKRVAVTQGSIGEIFLRTYLIYNNVPVESVKIVYLAPSDIVKAITAGTIDAALSWPPVTTEIVKRLGANVVRWPAQSGQDYYFSIIARESFLEKQSNVMERFIAALSDAATFMAKYRDRAQSMLRSRLEIDPDWSFYRFDLLLTQDQLVFMERQARWAIRNNLVKKKEMPNVLDLFYFKAIDKVKPEAVSIIH